MAKKSCRQTWLPVNCDQRELRCQGGGTRTDFIPAAVAAWIPISVSSNTRHFSGVVETFSAASKKASGCGLEFLYSPAQTSASKRSRRFSVVSEAMTESRVLPETTA